MTNPTPDAQLSTSTATDTTDESSGMSISRIAMLGAGAVIGVILLPLIFALVVSLTASETWAPVVQIFRDIFAVIFIIEGILIVGAIAILIVQIARFVVMLQIEIKPILDNARETTNTTKATAKFVSENTVDPLIRINGFFAGLLAFIRELLKIRGVVNPKKTSEDGAGDGDK